MLPCFVLVINSRYPKPRLKWLADFSLLGKKNIKLSWQSSQPNMHLRAPPRSWKPALLGSEVWSCRRLSKRWNMMNYQRRQWEICTECKNMQQKCGRCFGGQHHKEQGSLEKFLKYRINSFNWVMKHLTDSDFNYTTVADMSWYPILFFCLYLTFFDCLFTST